MFGLIYVAFDDFEFKCFSSIVLPDNILYLRRARKLPLLVTGEIEFFISLSAFRQTNFLSRDALSMQYFDGQEK